MNPASLSDLPRQVSDWLGRVTVVEDGGVPVERGLIEAFAVAVEDANPLYWDGLIAPPAMLSAWTRPHVWSPAGMPKQRPLELHFRLKELFGLPKAVVIETETAYHEPARAGDRVRAEQILDEVGPEVENRLGIGRKWTISIRYARQDGVLLGVESMRFFAYGDAFASRLEGESLPPTGSGVDAAKRRRVGGTGAAFSSTPDERRQYPPPGPAGRPPPQGGRLTSTDDLGQYPPLAVDMTATRIIMGAAASRDWQPQHHDTGFAKASGQPDIILNAPSQAGWLIRYLTGWAGSGSRIGRLRFRMARPISAGARVTFQGSVGASADFHGCDWLCAKLAIACDGQVMTDAAALLAMPGTTGPWGSGPGAWSIPDWNLM